MIVLRSDWAVWFPPLPCQRKNGSANARRSPSKALNEASARSIEGDPKEFCKTNPGDGTKKSYPLWLDDCLCMCGYSPSTNQAGGCGKILCHKAWISPNPHCHANYHSTQRWKHVWGQMPMHYQANNHALSPDQMWIMHCGCGFSTWSRRERSSIVRCLEQCLRRHWMSQKMKGSLDQGGFNHSVGHECNLNWPNRSSH